MLPDSQDKNMQKWPDRENLIACCYLIPFSMLHNFTLFCTEYWLRILAQRLR